MEAAITQPKVDSIYPTVAKIIADALSCELDEVQPSASLIDDLGAESIDFLDLVFRLESAFNIKVPADGLWQRGGDAAARAELARQVTPRTLADYLASLGAQPPGQP